MESPGNNTIIVEDLTEVGLLGAFEENYNTTEIRNNNEDVAEVEHTKTPAIDIANPA